MTEIQHFKSVKFHNFKTFKTYSLSLKEFNVLVGANNSGKSTIISGFRLLSEGIRRALSRHPEYIELPSGRTLGYPVPLKGLPLATENVFHDYEDQDPATIEFRISNGNELHLHFPAIDLCYMTCETLGRGVRTVLDFKNQYNASIGLVPVLGPVDHKEQLYQKEAARLSLLTHGASRNFRNIWHHFPEEFDDFRKLVQHTWPGMDIEPPQVDFSAENPLLHMFCPEERFPREIFWAGFGFQVWCQMLTFIVKSKSASLFIIDEPDIYLHSDLQRQLISLLKNLGPDILIATHSTEIISEAEPDDLLVVNKHSRAAKRISDPSQLKGVFDVVGSNLNPTLTQLAKTKRAVFVEGKDFQILSAFARKLGKNQVANRTDFAVIPVQGFNVQKVQDFSKGIELTIGSPIAKGIIFDKDYRSDDAVKEVIAELKCTATFVIIHKCKEIENYLLHPVAIQRAISRRILDRKKRMDAVKEFHEDVTKLLSILCGPMKNAIQGQYLSKRKGYERAKYPHRDDATLNAYIIEEFDNCWKNFDSQMAIVPGKEILSLLNQYLQETYQVSLSPGLIVSCFDKDNIPNDIIEIISQLENFRMSKIS